MLFPITQFQDSECTFYHKKNIRSIINLFLTEHCQIERLWLLRSTYEDPQSSKDKEGLFLPH